MRVVYKDGSSKYCYPESTLLEEIRKAKERGTFCHAEDMQYGIVLVLGDNGWKRRDMWSPLFWNRNDFVDPAFWNTCVTFDSFPSEEEASSVGKIRFGKDFAGIQQTQWADPDKDPFEVCCYDESKRCEIGGLCGLCNIPEKE